MSVDLFTPIVIGPYERQNRAVMAPLTRSRAGESNVPTKLNALYYAQRASAGLIISEATQIVPEGQGYISTPGIHSAEQIEGWRRVTRAVHVAGGRIFLQLLACRADFASKLPARWGGARCALRYPRRRAGLYAGRISAASHASGARPRRDSSDRGDLCDGGAECACRGIRRR